MSEEYSRSDLVNFRIHALEKLTEVLAEAIEAMNPGFGERAIADIREWAARDTTVAMLPQPEIDAVLDTFEGALRARVGRASP